MVLLLFLLIATDLLLLMKYHVSCILLQDRMTALHHAAMRGQVQVVETLIRLGADVNAFDKVSYSMCVII